MTAREDGKVAAAERHPLGMTNKYDFSQELGGRRALVTGGTRGIGAAIAQRFLDAGAKVAVTARSRGDAPSGATFVAGDVSSADGVKKVAAEVLASLGGLDILINNAGGGRGFPAGSAAIPDDEWKACLDLNLLSAVRMTNAVLPALRESKAAAIVNISSTAATMPFAAFAHYCAAKAALDMYSLTLATELAPHGIRVSVVSPGPIKTPGGEETRRALSDAMGVTGDVFERSVPLRRYGTPDDVAEVIALLTSDRGSWLTGGNIRVDGGMTAR